MKHSSLSPRVQISTGRMLSIVVLWNRLILISWDALFICFSEEKFISLELLILPSGSKCAV